MIRAWWIALTMAAIAAPAIAVGDEPDMRACLAAHETAQLRLNASELASARRELAVCSAASCHAAIQTECTRLLEDLEKNQPTIVIAPRRRDGRDVPGATVRIGDRAPLPVEGKPLEIDPGEHDLTVEARGHFPERQRVVVRIGEKNRSVQFVLQPIAPAPASGPRVRPPDRAAVRADEGWPTAVWVLGGVGVVAAGAAGYFYAAGFAEDRELREDCAASGCAGDRVDGVRTRFIVADVALAVALLSGAGALWMGLSSSGKSKARVAPGRQVKRWGVPSAVLVEEHPAR